MFVVQAMARDTPTAATIDTFRRNVNLTADALERWLETAESMAVGRKPRDGGESVGTASGRWIVELLRTRASDYTAADVAHMRKVNGFCARHLAQRPLGDVRTSRWRYSLMNWGHDPLKD